MTIAISGTTGITLDGQFNSASSMGFKNRIINGAMVIDQRNAGASFTPTNGAYGLDRFIYSVSQTSKITSQQSTTAPTGFSNSTLITSSSAYSISASDSFWFGQRVEGFNTADLGWGTANAQTVTLSFWVRSSLTGTFGGAINNSAFNRSYPFSYTISVANTWEQKTITITGDTSGTWIGATNGIGLTVAFSLGTGSTFSSTAGAWAAGGYVSVTGATSVVGTNGATFYITGVQLEKGSTATSFDYRPYGTELALCQRYYYRKNAGNSSEHIAVLQAFGSAGSYGKLLDLPVTMRANATCSVSSASHFTPQNTVGANTTAFSGLGSFASSNTSIVQVGGFTGSSGLAAGNASVFTFNTASGWIDASAEL